MTANGILETSADNKCAAPRSRIQGAPVWTLIILTNLAACSGGGGGFATDASSDAPSTETGDPALIGEWTFKNCSAEVKHDYRITITTERTVFRRYGFFANDATCATPIALEAQSYFYTVGDSTIANAREIDLTLEYITLTPLQAQLTEQWNNDSNCGRSNWLTNKPVDVAGSSCEFGSPTRYGPPGTPRYDIYRVEGGTRLYYGDKDSGGGTSTGTRPTRLDSGYYAKKP